MYVSPSTPVMYLFAFMPLAVQVTEVAYVESDGLIEALSKLPGPPRNLSLTQQVLRLVASAERGSEHPLAKVRFKNISLRFSPKLETTDGSALQVGSPLDLLFRRAGCSVHMYHTHTHTLVA